MTERVMTSLAIVLRVHSYRLACFISGADLHRGTGLLRLAGDSQQRQDLARVAAPELGKWESREAGTNRRSGVRIARACPAWL